MPESLKFEGRNSHPLASFLCTDAQLKRRVDKLKYYNLGRQKSWIGTSRQLANEVWGGYRTWEMRHTFLLQGPPSCTTLQGWWYWRNRCKRTQHESRDPRHAQDTLGQNPSLCNWRMRSPNLRWDSVSSVLLASRQLLVELSAQSPAWPRRKTSSTKKMPCLRPRAQSSIVLNHNNL